MDDWERRLQLLEHRAAIDDLNLRYFLAADGDDFTALGNCFAENATFALSGTVSGEGRDAIVKFNRGARSQMGLTVHTPHYGLYTFIDDKQAEGLVGAHLELVLAGEALFGAVRYQDTYIRTVEGWRFSKRDMRTIYIAPWSEVGPSLLSDTPVRWPGAAPMRSDYPRK